MTIIMTIILVIMTMLITMITIVIECFPAHDELGTRRTSYVCVLLNLTYPALLAITGAGKPILICHFAWLATTGHHAQAKHLKLFVTHQN